MAILKSIKFRVRLARWILVVIIALGLSACQPAAVTNPSWIATPTETFSDDQIQLDDLPPGWRVGGNKSENTSDVRKSYVWFYGTSDSEQSWINVSESIDVYPQRKRAIQAFEDLLAESFPPAAADAWKSIAELDFAHHADEWKVACLPATIDGKHSLGCRAVARYGNAVVGITGNVFDEQWMTLNDFKAVLEAADGKLTTYSQ